MSADDRMAAVKSIISVHPDLTEAALEVLADYVLYGKDEDGKSAVQKKEVQIKRRYKNERNAPLSLDKLTEDSLVGEFRFNPTLIRYRTPRDKFPRQDYENDPLFKDLYQTIDKMRAKLEPADAPPASYASYSPLPPDDEELSLEDGVSRTRSPFSPHRPAPIMSQYSRYLLQNALIEKYREQWTLRDYVNPTRYPHTAINVPYPQENLWDNSTYQVGPLGLYDERSLLFQPFTVTRSHPYPPNPPLPSLDAKFLIDFRNPKTIHKIIRYYEEFLKQALVEGRTSFAYMLIQTLFFYVGKARLTPIHIEIFRRKLFRQRNKQISAIVNKRFQTNYTDNYISTILTQQICPAISAIATTHLEEVENLHDPNKWTQCTACRDYKLRNDNNFCRKESSATGFSTQCKNCDRELRVKRKEDEAREYAIWKKRIERLGKRVPDRSVQTWNPRT